MFRSPKRSLAISAVALLTLTGCTSTASNSAASGGGECPANDLTSLVEVDATGSSLSERTKAANLAAIAAVTARTASCGGQLTVSAFGSSSGQTVTIFNGHLGVDAPTDNARTRKAEKLAEEVTREIAANYDAALASVPATATDVVGLLRLIGEHANQFPGSTVEALVLTDGLHNVGINPATAHSIEDTEALAEQVSVPDLAGVDLTFAGIGQANSEVPSAVVEQVSAFWQRLCARTNAASCTVVTDLRR